MGMAMRETGAEATFVGLSSAAATPNLSMQGHGENLPTVSNKRGFREGVHESYHTAAESFQGSKSKEGSESPVLEISWHHDTFGTTLPPHILSNEGN